MRMEELSDSRYIKNTDSVEKYLLNLVQEYFRNNNITTTTSREYIIKKAVERMKEEITFDSIGVISITLPNGETKTGAVSISIEDLNGEPAISPKYSAFNVNFGTEQNTACEGNDPRLSDARKPLVHEHEISDIVGLEGILSTLTGKAERIEGFLHTHTNMNVLNMLVYNGNNTTIDLTVLESLGSNLDNVIDGIRNDITNYRQEVDAKISDINTEVTNTITQVNDLKQYVIDKNQEYYDLSKQYTDDAITTSNDIINQELNKLLVKDSLSTIVNLVNNSYTFAGTSSFNLASIIDFGVENNYQTIAVDITSNILDEIISRGQSLQDCQIEYLLQYIDPNSGKTMYADLPYVLLYDNDLDGSIQVVTNYDSNQILVTLNSASFAIPNEIQDANIICKVYAKQNLVL